MKVHFSDNLGMYGLKKVGKVYSTALYGKKDSISWPQRRPLGNFFIKVSILMKLASNKSSRYNFSNGIYKL